MSGVARLLPTSVVTSVARAQSTRYLPDDATVAEAVGAARFDPVSLLAVEGVGAPVVDDRAVDNSSAVVVVSGSDDLLQLADAADRLKTRLYALDGVSRVEIVGDPGEQVTIAYADAVANRVGLKPAALAN